ncbi:MAG: TatD family hydrolase, partial [Proteobacteria bacterium]|nr:TatD family hydrolase [Pseudomonadota bacterium]
MLAIADNPLVIGIGETGLDYWEHAEPISALHKKIQRQRFRNHIRAAIELNKPLVIHSRAAG